MSQRDYFCTQSLHFFIQFLGASRRPGPDRTSAARACARRRRAGAGDTRAGRSTTDAVPRDGHRPCVCPRHVPSGTGGRSAAGPVQRSLAAPPPPRRSNDAHAPSSPATQRLQHPLLLRDRALVGDRLLRRTRGGESLQFAHRQTTPSPSRHGLRPPFHAADAPAPPVPLLTCIDQLRRSRHHSDHSTTSTLLRLRGPRPNAYVSLAVGQTLSDLCSGPTPLLRRQAKVAAYRFADPRYLMCLRLMLRKDPDTEKILKRKLTR